MVEYVHSSYGPIMSFEWYDLVLTAGVMGEFSVEDVNDNGRSLLDM